MNQFGIPPIAFIFIIIAVMLLIILSCLCWKRNHTMGEITRRYASATAHADQAASAANQQLGVLKRLTAQTAMTAAQKTDLVRQCQQYQDLYEKAQKAITAAASVGHEGYAHYRDGVGKQNMFFGGANDISYLFWRRREKEFFAVERKVRLQDPTMTLLAAHRLLFAHDGSDSAHWDEPRLSPRPLSRG